MKYRRTLVMTAGLLAAAGVAHAESKPSAAPDLSGVYYSAHPATALRSIDGRPIPLTDAGRAALAANAPKVAATKIPPAESAMDACIPAGPTRILEQPYPLEIVQKGQTIVLIWEQNHIWERVYLDTQLDPDADPSYMGSSVGHWEGPTLVIDSGNFNTATFLDDNGLPHSTDLKIQRRLRRMHGGKALQIEATVTDPAMYSQSWTIRTELPLRPDISIEEFVCGQKTLETRYTRAAK
jgi:hypothetical protein